MADALKYNVCLKMSELKERQPSVLKIVKILVRKQGDIYIVPRSVSKEEFVISIVQKGMQPQGDYREWKFKTKSPNIYAAYYERWLRFYQDKDEFWYLDRIYLHFYQLDQTNRTPSEYLLLHSDPNETREHAIYKQSPHLHIHAAPAPWPKAHIALNVGYLEPMLENIVSLTSAFSSAIVMIQEQVIGNIEST